MRLVRAFGPSLVLVLVPALAWAQAGGARAGGMALPGSAFGAPDQTVPKGTAVVLGQVVDTGSGQPIAEAAVTVRIFVAGARGAGAGGGRGAAGGARGQGAAPESPQTPPGPRIPANPRFVTDANGHFVVRDLPKGSIVVTVDAPGYMPGGSNRMVDDGERVRDLKISLQKYGVITGLILDDVGDPAVNITVRAMMKQRDGFSFASEDKTDDRGIYRIAGLTPGDYTIALPQTQATVPVTTFNSLMQGLMGGGGGGAGGGLADLAVSAAGLTGSGGVRVGDLQVGSSSGLPPVVNASGQIFVAPTMFYPSAMSASTATVVKVASGEERSGIDMQMRVVPTAKVSGTISGPAGLGLLQVQLRQANADADVSPIDVATTVGSANGAFTFLGVPAGQYVARIVRQPPPPIPAELASNPFVQMAMGNRSGALQSMMFAQAPVNVSNGDVTGIALTLTPGLTIGGHVVFDGTAAKPDANALAAIRVSLSGRGGQDGSADARVDSGGVFKSGGVLPGRYNVSLSPEPPPWVLMSVVVDGHDVLREGIDLSADATGAIATFTDRAATVSGNVHAASGAVPPATVVYLFPADVEAWIAGGMVNRGSYVGGASATGAFTIGRVLPGEYLIAAAGQQNVPNAGVDATFYRNLARGATRLTIALGDHPTVDAPLVKIP